MPHSPFLMTPDELSSGAEALFRHAGRTDVFAVDERSLATASCHAAIHGGRVFLARERDYGLKHIPLPGGERLHGVEKGTRLALLSADMERAVRISTAMPTHAATIIHLGNLTRLDAPTGRAGAPEESKAMPGDLGWTPAGQKGQGLLERSLDGCPVVRFGGYEYFVHPLSDGVPFIEGALLSEAVQALQGRVRGCDKIATAVSMGVPLAAPVAMRAGVPLSIALKSDPGFPGAVTVHQKTGYSTIDLYAGGVDKGERVVIVDDVLSTGGTSLALAEGIRRMGGEVVGGVYLFNKLKRWMEWQDEAGFPVSSLLHVEVREGRLERADWG